MTGPTHLDYDALVPVVAVLYRRAAYTHAGAGFLLPPPLPDCPGCGVTPSELATTTDGPDLFVRNRVAIRFRPCGHLFTADEDDLQRAHAQVRLEDL